MLDSYFFIPGDKKKYLDKINDLNADYIVIDLEDSVSLTNKQMAFDLVNSTLIQNNFFIRFQLIKSNYTDNQLIKLIKHFNGRIVLPKIESVEEIYWIKNLVKDIELSIILLFENPISILNCTEILKTFKKNIHAISIGSHDFCSIMGIKHNSENLIQYKRQLILNAKAFNIDFIDGVNVDFNNFELFENECKLAFDLGANGKFLIHPIQLKEFKKIKYLSETELNDLINIYNKIKDIPENEIEVYVIDNKVYEKPHIKRIKFIMGKLEENNF
jgi:citrate lyase subunit beta/citryl-CoA lyase